MRVFLSRPFLHCQGTRFEAKYVAVHFCLTSVLSTKERLCPWRRRAARTEVNALTAVFITTVCHRDIAVGDSRLSLLNRSKQTTSTRSSFARTDDLIDQSSEESSVIGLGLGLGPPFAVG